MGRQRVVPLGLVIILMFYAFLPPLNAQVENFGHRGTGTNQPANPFPENTIPSFQQAIIENADGFELDVQMTADDVPVVIHDSTLDRTTDCTGSVMSKTFAELGSCDAGYGTSMEGQGVAISSLAEVLAAFDSVKNDIAINVEIKGDGVPSDEMALAVTAVLDTAGWHDNIVISSFNSTTLAEVEALDSTRITGFLTSSTPLNAEADEAASLGLDGLHPQYALAFAPNVAYAQGLGLYVHVWTLNSQILMQNVIERGVDGIITDDPDKLYDVLTGDDDDDVTDDDDDAVDDDDDIVDDDDDTADDDDDSTDDDTADADDDIADDDTPVDSSDDDDDDDGCGC